MYTLCTEYTKPVMSQVVFNTSVCLDCGVKGDTRLLPRHCHMEPEDVHPGQVWHSTGVHTVQSTLNRLCSRWSVTIPGSSSAITPLSTIFSSTGAASRGLSLVNTLNTCLSLVNTHNTRL